MASESVMDIALQKAFAQFKAKHLKNKYACR